MNRLNYSAQERLAGLFVLSALAVIVMALLLGGQNTRLFQGRTEYVALMRNPVGVTRDTPVHISGIEAGSVTRIRLTPDNRFRIVLSVYKDYRNLVRTDSTAAVSKLALIGDSVINITPGSPELPVLRDGDPIEVAETMTLDQILAGMQPMLDNINLSIERISSVLRALPEDRISAALADTADVTAQLRNGGGLAGALLYDEGMRNDLAASILSLRETLAISSEVARASRDITVQLREAAGILRRQMQTVPELTMQTQELLDNARNTVDAIGNTWPVSANMPDIEGIEPEVIAIND